MKKVAILELVPFKYMKFLWFKFKYRKTIGPWMRWNLDRQTKEEIMKNGWK